MSPVDLQQLKPSKLDPAPKYQQIARKMTELIESGAWLKDHGVPSERLLVEQLEVSRVTARKALQIIADKGLIVRRVGSGTSVSPRLNQPLSRLSSFSEELRLRGISSSSTWLQRDVAVANSQELMALGLSSGARVTRARRLRRADETPMAIEYCRVPETLLPTPELIETSLYELLDSLGSPVVRALQTISAVNASAEQARLLEIHAGDAVIFVTRLGFGRDGRPMELTESYCRPGVYEFVAELMRTPTITGPDLCK
jgi:GntR family transcriptional regulator